jgi:hypothetical protein
MFEARIEDRLEIQDLIYRWCRGVDRRDWDLVRSVFHPDAHDDHGVFSGGVDDMIAWLKERHSDITQSMHHAGNLLIDFTGPNQAVVETSILARQRYAESAKDARVAMLGEVVGNEPGILDMQGCGRYVDRVERREDGCWKIADRVVVFEGLWASRAPDLPKPQEGWPLARRDKSDPVYAALAGKTPGG